MTKKTITAGLLKAGICLSLVASLPVVSEAGWFSKDKKAENDKLKIALLLPGRVDDVSWNQAMYQGMKQVEAKYSDKIEVKYVEEVYEVSDIEPALRDFAAEGYGLIFGHGFQFMEPIIKVAKAFPNTDFALGTGFKTEPNTCVYDVHLTEGGYLMGVLAAQMSKTGKIGVVGGADVSEIFRGHEAYKYGAKSINPDIEIQELYTGDWRDAAKAKEGAMAMYDSGVDIIWHSGDGIGLGVVDAAKDKDKFALSNVLDQNVLAPNNVLSGIDYHWESVLTQIIDKVLDKSFRSEKDKYFWLNVSNGGLQVAPYHSLAKDVPQSVKDKMKATIAGLKDGSIKLPEFNK